LSTQLVPTYTYTTCNRKRLGKTWISPWKL